jgi:expansin (peptidoglycan-binding protein)
MNYFYELSEYSMRFMSGSTRYWAQYNTRPDRFNILVMSFSDRAWSEDAGKKVKFAKNRFIGNDTECDMEEFIWVKLKCKVLDKI